MSQHLVVVAAHACAYALAAWRGVAWLICFAPLRPVRQDAAAGLTLRFRNCKVGPDGAAALGALVVRRLRWSSSSSSPSTALWSSASAWGLALVLLRYMPPPPPPPPPGSSACARLVVVVFVIIAFCCFPPPSLLPPHPKLYLALIFDCRRRRRRSRGRRRVVLLHPFPHRCWCCWSVRCTIRCPLLWPAIPCRPPTKWPALT